MNFIRVEEGLYLREDLIGAIQIVHEPNTGMLALRYFSTSGKEFVTDWTHDLDKLLVSLPMEIRKDVEEVKP